MKPTFFVGAILLLLWAACRLAVKARRTARSGSALRSVRLSMLANASLLWGIWLGLMVPVATGLLDGAWWIDTTGDLARGAVLLTLAPAALWIVETAAMGFAVVYSALQSLSSRP